MNLLPLFFEHLFSGKKISLFPFCHIICFRHSPTFSSLFAPFPFFSCRRRRFKVLSEVMAKLILLAQKSLPSISVINNKNIIPFCLSREGKKKGRHKRQENFPSSFDPREFFQIHIFIVCLPAHTAAAAPAA